MAKKGIGVQKILFWPKKDQQDGPSSGVKLDQRGVLENTLSLDLLTQNSLIALESLKPGTLGPFCNPSTLGTFSTLALLVTLALLIPLA